MLTIKLFKNVKIIDRLIAKIVDIMTTLIVYVSLLCIIHHLNFDHFFYTRYNYINNIMPFFIYIFSYLVINLYFLIENQQTFGKFIRGIRIVNVNGNDMALWRIIFIRELFFIALYAFAVTRTMRCVAFLIIIADSLFIFKEDRRCLHDLICDSQVIYINTNIK